MKNRISNHEKTPMEELDDRNCPDCGATMEVEDNGYSYLWTCPDEDCPDWVRYYELHSPEALVEDTL